GGGGGGAGGGGGRRGGPRHGRPSAPSTAPGAWPKRYARWPPPGAATGSEASGCPASTHARHRPWSRRSESSERYDERRRVAGTIPGYGRPPRKIGAVLLAALVAATWTHPLAFRPLPGWQSGASGITR